MQQLRATPSGPGIKCKLLQLLSSRFGPELGFATNTLAHGQSMQLIFDRSAPPDQFLPMPEQLP
jgi:hypothetical protein